jgi:hypothetical protein
VVTDNKHVQGRLHHLATERRARQRESLRETGVEVVHVELEVLLDDYIGESDDFLASEADRREKTRAHEEAIAECRRQTRDMAMRRKKEPRDIELYQD